ncbi:MAG: molybdopterin dehydrogenase FAD-binding protein [Streptosporangiaceae bacterium]|nr:molybdopterin dehydrogenase FAD-binding protein [Streptosporangiaceae bacterium]
MKPSAFTYHRPDGLDEVIDLLGASPDETKVLAGGQSLVPVMNFRLATPEHLVDVNSVAEMSGCVRENHHLRLGALTRHSELLARPEIREHCPLLAQAAVFIGHPQIRTLGTLGGSLAHADPSAELPGVAVTLNATMVVRGPEGERRIPAHEFFVSHFTTSLETAEVLTAVEVPVSDGRRGSAFLEVAARYGDFAMAGAAATVAVGEDDTVTEVQLACISVSDTPVRLSEVATVVVGQRPTPDVLAALTESVQQNLDPLPSLKASAAYKRRTAGVLAARAVERAWRQATRRNS